MTMEGQIKALGLGGLIALLVLILAVVFIAVGRLDLPTGAFIAALALARLV